MPVTRHSSTFAQNSADACPCGLSRGTAASATRQSDAVAESMRYETAVIFARDSISAEHFMGTSGTARTRAKSCKVEFTITKRADSRVLINLEP